MPERVERQVSMASSTESARTRSLRSAQRSVPGNGASNIGVNGLNGRKLTRSTGAEFSGPLWGSTAVAVTEEILETARNSLMARKKEELDQVFNRHDDLIREKFHMDTFTNLLGYNPMEFKTDNTEVFQDFKAPFDLLNSVQPDAGPSRRTRHSVNERKKMLPASSLSIPPFPKAISKPLKRRASHKPEPTTEILNILTSAHKGKGKGKEKEAEKELAVHDDRVSDVVNVSPRRPSIEAMRQNGIPNAPSPPPSRPGSPPTQDESASVIVRRKGGLKRTHSTTADIISHEVAPNGVHGKEKKRAKLDNQGSPAMDDKVLCAAQETSVSSGPTLRRGRAKDPPITRAARKPLPPVPLFPTEASPQTVSSPSNAPNLDDLSLPSSLHSPKHNIKRIKLIVRRPSPIYSNPRQRPVAPRYGQSLSRWLGSYVLLGDREVNDETRQRLARREAQVRERESRFRREGRFIPGTDVLFGTKLDPDGVAPAPYQPPKRDTKDAWDGVVEAVIAQGKLRATKKMSLGRQVAGQVASRIQAYWDAQQAKKGKAKAQEEKKLKALAKSTIKLVVNEWKRAVFHIREQARLKAEAEERRRGHAHLDAILDQSGQLLETQHSELRRDRLSSRGSSVSERLINWGAGSDEDTDEAGEEDDDVLAESAPDDDGHSSSDEDEVEGDVDNEVDSSMLLLDRPYRASPTAQHLGSESVDYREESALSDINPPLEGEGDEPLDHNADDEDSVADLDDLAIPDPESSPIRPAQKVLFEQNLVDYASSQSDRDTSLPPSNISNRSSPEVIPNGALHKVLEPSTRTPSPGPECTDNIEEDSSLFGRSSPGPPSETAEEDIELLDTVASTAFLSSDSKVSPQSLADAMSDEPMGRENEAPQPDLNIVLPEPEKEDGVEPELRTPEVEIPDYLKPYAVAPVDWDPSRKVTHPPLLRGVLRPYQQSGMEWLATLHAKNVNGILADEMGLGKTIQTIALLAHLACDRGIWGPHLIIVPTSVLLNWEMEFKKFLPGFKVLSYHGSSKRRKELRQGWMDKYHFNVCITSYTLASKDQHIFKRKPWYYMVLDEAHMIKNFRSQRWNILLMFRSFRRLLLTGTPLQNNLTELWALLQFLMSGSNFANLKEFGDWFSNPLEKAIEMGNTQDDDTVQRVSKLHTVLRPYLLRRLKRDVEKELPSKFEHLVLCPLSQRQRFLYDEFMSRAQTRQDLQSGVYQKIANILMQLRKVCNHPDLFEVRPIVTSFAMQRSAIADFEIKELLVRRRWLEEREESVNLDVLGLQFVHRQDRSSIAALETRRLDATEMLPYYNELPGEPPPKDTRTILGFRQYAQYLDRAKDIARWSHIGYLNQLRCNEMPVYSQECITLVQKLCKPITPLSNTDSRLHYWENVYRVNAAVQSYTDREKEMSNLVDRFAFATPPVVALDMPLIALAEHKEQILGQPLEFDAVLHRAAVKLQIAFPDPSLLQYDCGKLQNLAELLREKKLGGHRILIFTQMTRILDILEIFLNFHGYLYLRLDGATKIEDRQYITERFNADPRIFCFISSSRSGGVGINLTGADTVVFYDSDFNPQMDRQCEDRAHRIGQIRDVHIYRFVSQHTVEEAMLQKANQKRSLDDLVIQKGEFDWRSLFHDESALTKALGDCDDAEDAHAAVAAAKEAFALEGADEADFGGDLGESVPVDHHASQVPDDADAATNHVQPMEEEEEEEGGTTVDYMVAFVQRDYDFFQDWRL